jgi:hypothetical protein
MNDQLTQLYVIEWDGGADYVCQSCANEWVKENGLEWENDHSLNYVKENDQGLTAWVDFYGQVETDYPPSCECGQWLKGNLTTYGENYIKENFESMPKHVIEYYQIERDEN